MITEKEFELFLKNDGADVIYGWAVNQFKEENEECYDMELKGKKLYLLDMDGTIYLGDDLFGGTLDFLDYVKKIGGKYMFLTNNSSKSVDKYVKKLEKLGISATENDFFTSTDATIMYLKPKNFKKIYAFGTTSFKEQLLKAGLNITDRLEEGIDCLLMGFDTELTFQKLEDACKILNQVYLRFLFYQGKERFKILKK